MPTKGKTKRVTSTRTPDTNQISTVSLLDKYSTYPSNGLAALNDHPKGS